MYNFSALTGVVKHLRVRRLFACVLLLAVVGNITSRAQPSSPADLAQVRARAEQSDPEAQNALGNVYTNGLLGVKPDYAEALAWYRKAADKGFAPAQFNLGLVYEMGRGVPADERQAFKNYLMAAEQGFGAAQFNIGNMYSTGRGVGQDLFEATLWYKQAAEKGIVEAQFNLGLGYEAGRGVKKDESQAARWYKLAADRGFARAQYNLGLLYEDGRGVAKNEAAAAGYYRAAADQGFAPAQNNYGVMMSEGRGGLAKNPVEAYVWLSLATESGASPSARDFVARSLSAEQLVVANRALSERKGGRSAAAAATSVPTAGATNVGSAAATQASAVPSSSPVVSASAARIAELTEALERARQANSQYSEANQRLELEKAQLAQQLSQPSESGKLIEQLRDQSRRLAGQVESLTIEKDIAQREITVLGAQLKDAQQNAARPPASANSGDSTKLQADVASLSTQLAQANIELNQLRQTNQQLTQANTTLQHEKAAVAVAPSRPASGNSIDASRYPLQESEKDSIIAGLQRDIVRLNDEVKRSGRELTAVNLQLRSLRNQPPASTSAADAGQSAQLAAKAEEATQEATRLAGENSRLAARIAELEQQPKPTPVDPTLAPRLAQTQQELQVVSDKLAAEKQNFTQTQARVGELEKQLVVAQQQASSSDTGAEDLKKQLATATQTLAQSAARITDLTEGNQRLQAEVVSIRQAGELAANQVRQQLASVQQELAAARQGAAGLVTIREENQKLASRLAELEKQPKPTVDETLAPRLAKAEQTAAQLQEQLRSLQGEKSDLEKWAQTLEKNQEEKTALAVAAAAETSQLKQKLEDAEKRFNNASKLVAEQQATAKKLAEENKTLAEKAAAEAGPTRAAVTELNNVRQQLIAEKERSDRWMKSSQSMTEKAAEESGASRKAQAALAEIKKQLVETEKKLADNTNTIHGLSAELTTAKQHAARAKADSEEIAQLRSANEAVTTLRQENSRLTARVTELENQPKPVVDETLVPRLTQAQARVAALEKELTAAREQEAGTNASIDELKKQLDASNQTLERTTASFTGLTDANKQLETELTQMKSGGEKAATAASTQLAELRQQLSAATTAAADAAKLRDQNQRLAAQVTQLENQPKPQVDETLAPRLAQSQQRIAALETELRSAQQQAAANTGQVGELQKQLANANQATEKASDDLTKLTVATETARRDFEATKLQLSEAQKELYITKQNAASANVLRSENTRLASRITELETQVQQASAEQALAPKLAEAQTRISSLEKDLRAAQQQASGGAANLGELKQQLASMTENFEQSSKAVAGLQSELATAKQSVADAAALRAELATLRASAGDVAGLRDENSRLTARILDLQSAPKPAQDDSLAQKLAQAQQQLRTVSDKAAADRSNYIQSQARVASLEADLRIEQRKSNGNTSDVEDLKKQLADATAGLEKSNAEVAALQENLAAARQDAADAAAIKEENARLIARVNELQNQPKPVVDDTLAPRLEQAQAKVASLETELRSAQKSATDNSANVGELRKQLAEAKQAETAAVALRAENARLAEQLTDLQKRPAPDQTLATRLQQAEAKVTALESELRTAQERATEGSSALNDLRQQLAASKQAVASAAEIRTQNNQLITRLAELENRPAVDTTLPSKLVQAQDQVRALTNRVAGLEKDLLAARQTSSGSESEIAAVKRELATAVQSLQTSKASVVELSGLNKQLEAETLSVKTVADRDLAQSRETVAALQRQLADAQLAGEQVAALRDEVTKLRAASADLNPLRDENARLTARVAELQNQPKPATDDTLAPRLAQGQTRITALEAELQKARQEIAGIDDFKKQLEESNQALEKSGASVAELTALNDRLEKDVAAARQTAQRDSGALRTQVADLQKQLTAAKQNSTDSGALREEVTKLRAESAGLATLRSENERLRAASAETATLRTKLEQLTRDNEQLASFMNGNRRDLDTAQARVATLEKQIVEAKATGGRSTEEVKKLQVQLAEANQAAEKLNNTVGELTVENDRLEKDLDSAKKSVNAALAAQAQAMSATQPDAYKMEISTLNSRVKELEGQLEDDRGNTAREFASLASQLQRARETNKSLSEANRALMSAKQAEIPTVNKDEFDQVQSRVKDLVAGSDELRRQNQKLTEENQRLTADQASVRQQFEDARKAATLLPGLADEKAELQERLEAVGGQLAKAQQQIDTLQKDSGNATTQLLASQQAAQRAQAELAALRARATDAEKAAESHNTSVAELTDVNTKLEAERDDLRRQVAAARAENSRLAQTANSTEQLKAEADRSAQQNIDTLSAQLVQARRELQSARETNARIADANAAQERERAAALVQLRQENTALASRLAQAQGTLDQIASAARLATPASVLASGGTPQPTPQTSQTAARYHLVAEGDSLSRISLRYYGTANRWQEIFQANRDVLQGSSTLRVGMQLRIP